MDRRTTKQMAENNNYPFEIKDCSLEENAEVFKYFNEGYQDGFIRIGPEGYFFTNGFKSDAANIYNMPLRKDDTFVVTFPKAGTTWTQELVWLVANDFDYEGAKTPLPMRFPFMEMHMLLNSERSKAKMKKDAGDDENLKSICKTLLTPGSELVADMPSPRFIKSHLPLSLLPPSLLDTTKVIYVARDPRDVVVSFYHHNKLFNFMGYTGDFKQFWEYFIKDQIDWTPFFPHIIEAWDKRNHPNMMFLFYEDMIKDLPSVVLRVADFLGKKVTDEQVKRVCEHLSFSNFKKNKAVNYETLRPLGWLSENSSFVRKGKSGGWRDYFDEEMTKQAEEWIERNLRGTDLQLPQVHK